MGCSLWSSSVMLVSTERKKVGLISREICFRGIPTRVITIHQRYRRTDRQTTYYGNTALRYASYGNNTAIFWVQIWDFCSLQSTEGVGTMEHHLTTKNRRSWYNGASFNYQEASPDTYIDGSLGLDEPSTEHWLYLTAAQLRVNLMDFMLHLFLQQQPPQPPVEELAARLPTQYLLFTLQNITHSQ